MQSLGIDGSSYDRTRALLEPIISKPKLADKLLSKPPMRFIHDVVMAVTAATGFADGLYNEEERVSDNMKEKPQKVQFLEKIINCVGIQLNMHCPVCVLASQHSALHRGRCQCSPSLVGH